MGFQYIPLSGRIVIDDDGARVTFDSVEEMLSVHPNDVKVGSVVVPARTASSEGVDGSQIVVDVDTEYFLADLQLPGAHVVRGMMRSTWASSPEPADNLWRQASGTHLDILDGVSTTQVPQSDLGGYDRVATLGGYTLYVNDIGHLVMRERIVMRCRDSGGPPTKYNRARQQATISFRLLIGFFLGADFNLHPACRYRDFLTLPSLFSTFTSNRSFGYPFAGRRCVVIVHGFAGDVPTSITVGGTALTIHDSIVAGNATATIASAVIATGDVMETVVTFGPSQSGVVVETYVVANVGSTVTTTKTAVAAGLTASVTPTVGPASVAIIAATVRATANNPTVVWTGADEQAEINVSEPNIRKVGSSAIVPHSSGTVTVTADVSQSSAIALLGAVFS